MAFGRRASEIWRRAAVGACVAVLACVLPRAAAAEDEGPFELHWSGVVPELQSADGSFRIRPRLRIQADASGVEGSIYDRRNEAGMQLRSLQLGVEGAAWDVNYAFTADFADHQVAVRNAFLAWRTKLQPAELEITLGNRLTERGLEGSSSGEATSFLERNVVAAALSPLKGYYGLGLTVKAFGPGWHIAGQIAGDDINNPEVTHGTTTATLRGHWNPRLNASGALHLGVWGYHEDFTHAVTSLSRDTYWGGQRFNDDLRVSLGRLAQPQHADGYGVELGGTRGQGWMFGEYGERRIVADGGPFTVRAWTGSMGWVLIGGRPSYTPRTGNFSRQRPKEPVSKGGPGLVEIAGRYERLDNSDAPRGGRGETVTVGASWWLEDWLRVTANASCWSTRNATGGFQARDDGRTATIRAQIAF